MSKKYEYDAVLHELPDSGGAYVPFPWDIRAEFGKGRVKVHARFDGIPYDGSIVSMGVKNPDGSVCYIIGVLKAIRKALHKADGDTIHVMIEERLMREPDPGTASPPRPYSASFRALCDQVTERPPKTCYTDSRSNTKEDMKMLTITLEHRIK